MAGDELRPERRGKVDEARLAAWSIRNDIISKFQVVELENEIVPSAPASAWFELRSTWANVLMNDDGLL